MLSRLERRERVPSMAMMASVVSIIVVAASIRNQQTTTTTSTRCARGHTNADTHSRRYEKKLLVRKAGEAAQDEARQAGSAPGAEPSSQTTSQIDFLDEKLYLQKKRRARRVRNIQTLLACLLVRSFLRPTSTKSISLRDDPFRSAPPEPQPRRALAVEPYC